MKSVDPEKNPSKRSLVHASPVDYASLSQTILTRFGYTANWGARALFYEIEKATRFSKSASALPSLSKQIGTSLKRTAAIVGYSLVTVALFTPCLLAYAIAALGRGRFEKKVPRSSALLPAFHPPETMFVSYQSILLFSILPLLLGE